MGSGKTTLGQEITKHSNYKFTDTDVQIIAQEKISIDEIFKTRGEAAFRTIEHNICKTLSKLRLHVIATGGGIIETAENRLLLKKAGFVIFLDSPFETCLSRIQICTARPLAALAPEALHTRWQRRHPLYLQTANVTLKTENKSIPELANEILKVISL